MAYNGTTFDRVTATAGALNVNVTNPLTVDINGLYDAGTNPTPDTVGNIFHTRAATPDETNQTFRSTGGTPTADNIDPTTVHGIDAISYLMGWDATGTNYDRLQSFAGSLGVALHDQAGAAYTVSNPLPVYISDSVANTEINSYDAASAVAAAATSVHTYTVTAGKTFKFAQVQSAASGKMKTIVSVETGVATGVYNTIFSTFNSTANPNISIDIKELVTVAAGVRVRVQKTNLELLAQDLYSTISGFEI